MHINESSHMGRLYNEVSHNAVNFYHCFKMWASQEKKYLHYTKFDQAIYYKPFPLRLAKTAPLLFYSVKHQTDYFALSDTSRLYSSRQSL